MTICKQNFEDSVRKLISEVNRNNQTELAFMVDWAGIQLCRLFAAETESRRNAIADGEILEMYNRLKEEFSGKELILQFSRNLLKQTAVSVE